MQVHLTTLGCRLNEAELETWAQGFQNAGHSITRRPEKADLIILNSCAVTTEAERKSRHQIRKIHRNNPRARLVVSGCYATLNPQEAEQSLGADLVISNQHKSRLVDRVLSELDFASMPQIATEPGEPSLFSRGRQRAFVKVQDGCRYRCTFCIVTVARGNETSRSIEAITHEINSLRQQGINEVILTGVHLGGYGTDINQNLESLLSAILENTDMPRIRLGSLEPWDLPENFLQLFENERMMPHLHLPLQSGSDTVLRRMARRCKSKDYGALVKQLKAQIPNFNITTDIIVGFPGETDREWQQSLDFIAASEFGHIHIFSYSPRTGTAAARMPGQIENRVKKKRSQQLHLLAAESRQAFMEKNIGLTFPVLWESQKEAPGEEREAFGYTPNYLRARKRVSKDTCLENRILPARLLSIEKGLFQV